MPYLQSRGHDIIAICSHDRPIESSVHLIRYPEPSDPPKITHTGQELWHTAIARANQIALICSQLESQNLKPHVILAHSGWGESIAIKEVWPDVPHILWPELWVLPLHGGYGSDTSLPEPNLSHRLEQLGRNALTRVALDQAAAWVLPTIHQANSFPVEFQNDKLSIIHEGINTDIAKPDPDVSFQINDITIDRSVPVITFVNRNLERLRGFDTFMRSIPEIQRLYPDCRFLIVGDNDKGYGNGHPSGRPLRDVMLEELSDHLDLTHIHFLGRIPYPQLISVLQVSSVHVYLSYPFILGWSLLEAMSIGCSIVASKGPPVSEVITDGVEGLLVSMDDHQTLAKRVVSLLSSSSLRESLSRFAQLKASTFDQSKTLPKLTSLIENIATQ